jgi:hypothetical protein
MPAAIPLIVGAVASYAASAALATVVTGTILGFTVSGIIGSAVGGLASMAASALLTPKAKAQRTGSNSNSIYPYVDNGVKTNDRNTVQFAQGIYGQSRVTGTVLMEKLTSSGVDNTDEIQTGRDSYLHQIIGFAIHECEEFVSLYLDDDVLEIDSDGWVLNAKYTNNTDDFDPKAFESYPMSPYTATNASGTGTSASIYVDVSYATATTKFGEGDLIEVAGFSDSAYNGQFLITSIATHAAGVATRINYTTDSTITSASLSQTGTTTTINPVGYRGLVAYGYNSAGHGLSEGDNVFIYDASPSAFNDEKTAVTDTTSDKTFSWAIESAVTNTSQSGSFQRRNGTNEALVNIQTFLGTSNQDVSSDANVSSLMPNVLQSTDNFKGICCAYVRFYDASKFSSAPQLTGLIKGAKIYDPRDGSLAWSDNAALIVMDYLTRKIGENADVPIGAGLNYDTGANTSTDLNLDSFRDSADACDEQIYLADGSQARRYTINGLINLGDQPVDVISLMTPCFQGALTDYDFRINISVAAYEPAIHHIDETWLVGSIMVEIDNDKQSLANTIRAIYNDEDKKYYPDDMPQYQSATYLAQDNGEVLAEDLQLSYVKESERAQRLAKIYLNQRRANRKIYKLALNAKGKVIAPYDNVSFSYARWNMSNKIFKVLTISQGLLNEPVSITMREETSDIYEWDASEAS